MAAFILIQWPPRELAEPDWPPRPPGAEPGFGVFLQDRDLHLRNRIAEGARLLIYQTKRAPLRRMADGRPNPARPGKQGIIAFGTARLVKTPARQVENYLDGEPSRGWNYIADIPDASTAGFVPLARVNRILGYKPGNVLRGTRLRALSEETADALAREFERNSS
jgi:hypothetical protein